MTEQALTTEEIAQLRHGLEIEKIRKKKVLYSHLLDSLRIDEWIELFAEDAVSDWGAFGKASGRAAIRADLEAQYAGRSEPYYGMHMTTNLWVELTGPATAVSRAYLHDINNDLDPRINPLRLLGVYEEEWEKIDGDWKIKRQFVQFLWPQRTAGPGFPHPVTPAPLG